MYHKKIWINKNVIFKVLITVVRDFITLIRQCSTSVLISVMCDEDCVSNLRNQVFMSRCQYLH